MQFLGFVQSIGRLAVYLIVSFQLCPIDWTHGGYVYLYNFENVQHIGRLPTCDVKIKRYIFIKNVFYIKKPGRKPQKLAYKYEIFYAQL